MDEEETIVEVTQKKKKLDPPKEGPRTSSIANLSKEVAPFAWGGFHNPAE